MVNTDALGEAGDSSSLSGKLLIAVTTGTRSIKLFSVDTSSFPANDDQRTVGKTKRCYISRDGYRCDWDNNGWGCALKPLAAETDLKCGRILFPVLGLISDWL